MTIITKVIAGDAGKNQRAYYGEVAEAEEDGWVIALEKHRKGLSFCILYKEVK